MQKDKDSGPRLTSAEVEEQTKQFLASGGQVTEVEAGETTQEWRKTKLTSRSQSNANIFADRRYKGGKNKNSPRSTGAEKPSDVT